jgi:hypothetical protein
MSSPYQLSLLRRTFAAIAAASSLFAVHDVAAQGTVTLTGASGSSCTYSSMSVTPNGNVAVQCSTVITPPPPDPATPGSFSFDSAGSTVAPGAAPTKPKLKVVRSGGSKGAFRLSISPYGAACWGQPDTVDVLDGSASLDIEVTLGNLADTFCEYTITAVSPTGTTTGATLGTTKTTRLSVGSTGPAPSNCPATPTNMINASFVGKGNPLLQMQGAGQIVAIKMPDMAPRGSGQVTFGESAGGAYTPQPVTIEISINKCPGVIDTDYTSACNLRNTNGHYNSITWLTKPYDILNETTANRYGLCWTPVGTQYYVNARWSYTSCAFGAQVCGFAVQYNDGPY